MGYLALRTEFLIGIQRVAPGRTAAIHPADRRLDRPGPVRFGRYGPDPVFQPLAGSCRCPARCPGRRRYSGGGPGRLARSPLN
jgi:hypothetical protein